MMAAPRPPHPRVHRIAARVVLLFAAFSFTAGCPARTAVGVAGNVAGTAVQATGTVVGGTIKVLTFAETGESPLLLPPSEVTP